MIDYRIVTETRTAKDLKEKYHEAVMEKATSERIMRKTEESLQKVHVEVLTMIKSAQQTLRRSDKIAPKPTPNLIRVPGAGY